MAGLFLSEAILFIAAALIGFALGWRLHALALNARRKDDERHMQNLRSSLSEAQVRRARNA
ncbi:MAG TPA: hypothetical protein VHC73_09195 [Vitreimonas sp.]|jgi:hypothetical protein|nr:hypothetical protein [Vitreimonas sp.]